MKSDVGFVAIVSFFDLYDVLFKRTIIVSHHRIDGCLIEPAISVGEVFGVVVDEPDLDAEFFEEHCPLVFVAFFLECRGESTGSDEHVEDLGHDPSAVETRVGDVAAVEDSGKDGVVVGERGYCFAFDAGELAESIGVDDGDEVVGVDTGLAESSETVDGVLSGEFKFRAADGADYGGVVGGWHIVGAV